MKLINDTAHRPFLLTSENWIMRQTWRNLLFVHWPISPETIREHIHPSLQIDTFNGVAWLGIVVFELEGIYPRGFPPISILPPFPEINVRTYVQYNGKPGVYFLSLDVSDWASYTLAKRWFHLPYHSANISIKQKDLSFHFESIRKKSKIYPILCKGTFSPLPEVYFPKEGTLDHWLTERYCLFSTNNKGRIFCGEIHHRPWPLQKANSEIYKNNLFSPFKIDLSGVQPISHFSKGVDSLIWNIRKAY
ncbi:DUF2071 domain-containing protein [Bacillus sp. FJAT-49705]|uniref:DUF2071 domain-containing protein n=1 Tax=Cytobacillus citreus TaxID=2833586 RepID=A0ABS5NMC7_9BACI|nr:DUF2071 domain-containing protein [Cytobacillus citreus]MBS4188956.1 DUF2071 domain-containing protein [Cytobacillus citreus]